MTSDRDSGARFGSGPSASADALPRIDADRCVHALCATATCRACVTACPRGAWVIDDAALGFDAEACDGCGVCRPACPEAAIGFAPGAFEPLVEGVGKTALLACEAAGVSAGRGVVACLHAVGERELGSLRRRGVELLVTAAVDCTRCRRNTARKVSDAVARLGVMLSSRAQAPLRHVELGVADWARRRDLAAAAGPPVDHGRRALFGLGRARSADAPGGVAPAPAAERSDAIFRHVPEIDAETCTGCDACARICPHGAIRLARGSEGLLGYRFDAANCTGCRLCIDVCEVGAVRVDELRSVTSATLYLDELQCHRCGVPFHRPMRAAADDTAAAAGAGAQPVCTICRRTDHTRNLFQVHKS
jgi:ferredoxin